MALITFECALRPFQHGKTSRSMAFVAFFFRSPGVKGRTFLFLLYERRASSVCRRGVIARQAGQKNLYAIYFQGGLRKDEKTSKRHLLACTSKYITEKDGCSVFTIA